MCRACRRTQRRLNGAGPSGAGTVDENQQGQDPDLKAWAAKTLPTLEDHLRAEAEMRQLELRRGGAHS
jgi:hypothetical protein